jgi:hypothetical protein
MLSATAWRLCMGIHTQAAIGVRRSPRQCSRHDQAWHRQTETFQTVPPGWSRRVTDEVAALDVVAESNLTTPAGIPSTILPGYIAGNMQGGLLRLETRTVQPIVACSIGSQDWSTLSIVLPGAVPGSVSGGVPILRIRPARKALLRDSRSSQASARLSRERNADRVRG